MFQLDVILIAHAFDLLDFCLYDDVVAQTGLAGCHLNMAWLKQCCAILSGVKYKNSFSQISPQGGHPRGIGRAI